MCTKQNPAFDGWPDFPVLSNVSPIYAINRSIPRGLGLAGIKQKETKI